MARTSQLSRWDPFRDLQMVQSELNRLFGQTFDGADGAARGSWAPFLDMYENGDVYVVNVDLPGMNSDDVDLTVDNNVLTIRGERRFTEEVKDEQVHRIERRFGQFQRSIALPQTVDVEGIQASFADGVLRIEIPKAEQAKARKIKIAESRRQIEA